MARHYKNGLEYFSHDTTMKDDTKIKLLKAKFGIFGYGVYNLILEDIYKESYYLKINEDYILLFESENNIPEGDFMKVILFMISKGLFDNAYYEKYSILTSKRIQQNYLRGCTRRKNVTLVKQYLLINPDEVLNETEKKATTIIYDNINTKSDNINDSINTQSKVKETEIEKEIEKETETIEFENFWNLYDKKVGDKKKIFKKYTALPEQDKLKIQETLKDYIASTPDKKFRKNPETYLNNHSWNDEIIKICLNGIAQPTRRNTLQDF